MKKIKLLFIILFLILINSVAIQFLHPIIKVSVVNENRTKIEWPQETLWAGLRDGSDYSSKVEQYFSDHFPLRDFMLRCLGQLEYSALGTSRENIIGKDGWLSDKKVLAEQLHQLDLADDQQVKVSILQIKRLQYWLQNRGIDFLMVVIPMKPSIYPEKFPERYTSRPEQTGLQRFQNSLTNNHIPYLDLLTFFKQQKNQDNLYYKTDLHWNTVASTHTAEAIINHFSSKILGKKIWAEEMIKGQSELSGVELNAMPLLFPKPEMAPSWASPKPAYIEDRGDEIVSYISTDKSRAVLPPSIMLGNSFMAQYPGVGYSAYFNKSTFLLDYHKFSKVLDYVKPEHKIFILQIYETQLLFHIMPSGTLGFWSGYTTYWDDRIQNLPLPPGFVYQ